MSFLLYVSIHKKRQPFTHYNRKWVLWVWLLLYSSTLSHDLKRTYYQSFNLGNFLIVEKNFLLSTYIWNCKRITLYLYLKSVVPHDLFHTWNFVCLILGRDQKRLLIKTVSVISLLFVKKYRTSPRETCLSMVFNLRIKTFTVWRRV